MARISRTDIYDYDTLPTFEDYVIGTDPEDFKRTRNYRIADIIGLANGTATRFTTLFDTPADYIGQAGKVVTVNDTEDGLVFEEGGGGSSASDVQYGVSWDANMDAATKNVLYDKIQTLVTLNTVQTITAGKVFNAATDHLGGLNIGQFGVSNPSSNRITFSNILVPSQLQAAASPSISFSDDNLVVNRSGDNTEDTFYIFNGSGITSPRTYTLPDKSGTVALLDDITPSVEVTKGNFTPVLISSNGNYSYSMSEQVGKYVRIDDVVHYVIIITVSSSSGAGFGGTLQITGVPLTSEIDQVNQVMNCLFNQEQYAATFSGDNIILREYGGFIANGAEAEIIPNNTTLYITGSVLLNTSGY
jgi:hypothetical protein